LGIFLAIGVKAGGGFVSIVTSNTSQKKPAEPLGRRALGAET
jgi:hypothetical protein